MQTREKNIVSTGEGVVSAGVSLGVLLIPGLPPVASKGWGINLGEMALESLLVALRALSFWEARGGAGGLRRLATPGGADEFRPWASRGSLA